MRCFHCTEQVAEADRGHWTVVFDGAVHEVCCAGCEAVAATILEAGLGDYYRFRSEPAAFGSLPRSLTQELDAFAIWDAPEVGERYVHGAGRGARGRTPPPPDACEVNLAVEGMRCGACVWLLERRLGALPGVHVAEVNYASERARVVFDPDALPLSALLRGAAKVGYRVVPFDASLREAADAARSRTLLRRLFVAGLGAMQVMMYALPVYLSGEGGIEPHLVELLRWASLVLTTPVMLYAAQPFLAGAWRDLRARAPGMDVPVAIGLLVAFGASVFNTLRGGGEVWFDSVSMFVFLLLTARWLEWSARRRARSSLDALLAVAPETARRLSADGTEERVPAVRLGIGDRVAVLAGERVPVDGCLLDAAASIDRSLLTGESVPASVRAGETVPGGALVAGAPIRIEVLRTVEASTLSLIGELVDRGAAERPAAVRLADRIARVFVASLLVVAAATFALWWRIDPARAPEIAIAVLVVSCPCALSLATPAALAAATGRLLRGRVLVTRGHALETIARVTDVVFDKTGTLTAGEPELAEMRTGEGTSRDAALGLAAALEAGSDHPHARALRRAAAERLPELAARSASLPFEDIEHVPGAGVGATLPAGPGQDAACVLRLGSAVWCGIDEAVAARWRALAGEGAERASEVFLSRRAAGGTAPGNAPARATDGMVDILARFALRDPVRPGAAALVSALREHGCRVHLLSGDREPAAREVAARVGIEAVRAEASPEDKREAVRCLQRDGARVLMIGDGINDAPVMALADVSFALGRATDLARTAADAVSLADGLEAVAETLAVARSTARVIRQNLTWALGYNALAIPLTALGLVPPWAAAVGMAASSVAVSANALRLLHRASPAVPPSTTRWMPSSS